jgi:hypothetical protein
MGTTLPISPVNITHAAKKDAVFEFEHACRLDSRRPDRYSSSKVIESSAVSADLNFDAAGHIADQICQLVVGRLSARRSINFHHGDLAFAEKDNESVVHRAIFLRKESFEQDRCSCRPHVDITAAERHSRPEFLSKPRTPSETARGGKAKEQR